MKGTLRKAILFLIAGLITPLALGLSAVYAESTDLNYLDLNNWKVEEPVLNGDWRVVEGGRTVTQDRNSNPTFFVSPDDMINKVIKGTIKVAGSAKDDDMIGFVLGFQPPKNIVSTSGIFLSGDYDFIVFDWKSGQQDNNLSPGAFAYEGFALLHIAGNLSTEEYSGGLGGWSKYLWSRVGGDGISTVLGKDYGSGRGWRHDVEYPFEILYTESRIKIKVGGAVIFDIDATNSAYTGGNFFKAGRIGFYNNSQAGVTYGNVQIASVSEGSLSPVAQDDRYGMSKDGSLLVNAEQGLLFNDYHPTLENYSIELETLVSEGALNLNLTTGAFTYTPNPGFTGMDTFTYRLLDAKQISSEIATVKINVIDGMNVAPTDIALTNSVIEMNPSNGSTVGQLATVDANEGDFHDYMLIDNSDGRFGIRGNVLLINDATKIASGNRYSITVRSTDFAGEFVNRVFEIDVKAPYSIEHHLQSVDGMSYVLESGDTGSGSGVSGTSVTAIANTYTGFTEKVAHFDRVASGTITSDGALVLKLYYDRNDYEIVFNSAGGSSVTTLKQKYGTDVTAPDNPTRTGYTFDRWSPILPGTMPAETNTHTAQWNANTTTPYTVEHYAQNVTGSAYTVIETQELTGTTDAEATAVAKEYSGFGENTTHSDRLASGIIAADGALVLKLYYDRNDYEIVFNSAGGSSVTTLKQKYGTDVTAPDNPTRTGYTFDRWSPILPGTMPAETNTHTAQWNANTTTPYTVEHYAQNVTGSAYTVIETQELTGTTDAEATAVAKEYPGFGENTTHSESIPRGTITADGSLVLKLHYDRILYEIVFIDYDDKILETQEVRFEGAAVPPADPSRNGYRFTGWNEEGSNITTDKAIRATYRRLRSVEEPDPTDSINVIVDDQEEEQFLVTREEDRLIVSVTREDAEKVSVQLTGAVIKDLEDNNQTLMIRKEGLTFSIPASEFSIEKVAKSLQVDSESLDLITVKIQMNSVELAVNDQVRRAAAKTGYEILMTPLEFNIIARTTDSKGEGREVEINRFTTYVERTLDVPEGVAPAKISTGVVFNSDGTFSHIPTVVFMKEGKHYIKMSSLTNSSYSTIWNPTTVATVEKHWSKLAVNDMASRFIIKNPDEFLPNEAISRAEFAEYITKALGIYRTNVDKNLQFKDVNSSSEAADAIQAAVNYGIIAGYPDGTFKPYQTITREEAMTMYAKAMDIVKLAEVDNNRITTYSDATQISEWAYAHVRKTVSANVFNGRTTTTIVPKGIITYAEAATAIRNLLLEADLIND